MKILVCGDRTWADKETIKRVLYAIVGVSLRQTFSPIILIHGAAPGADSLAGEVAHEAGWNVEQHPANWARYGRAAGPIRNTEMLAERPDIVVAFHAELTKSRGTKDMLTRARLYAVPVYLITGKEDPCVYPTPSLEE